MSIKYSLLFFVALSLLILIASSAQSFKNSGRDRSKNGQNNNNKYGKEEKGCQGAECTDELRAWKNKFREDIKNRERDDYSTVDATNRYAYDQPCIIGDRGFRGSHGLPGNTGPQGFQGTPGIFHTLVDVVSNTYATPPSNPQSDTTETITISRTEQGGGHPRITRSSLMMTILIDCIGDIPPVEGTACFNDSVSVELLVEWGYCQCHEALGDCPSQGNPNSGCGSGQNLASRYNSSPIVLGLVEGRATKWINYQLETVGEMGSSDVIDLAITVLDDGGLAGSGAIMTASGSVIDEIYYQQNTTDPNNLYDLYYPQSELDQPWNPIDL